MHNRRPMAEHCQCGSTIKLLGFDDRGDEQLLHVWRGLHFGPGHQRVTGDEAVRARKRGHLPRDQRGRERSAFASFTETRA